MLRVRLARIRTRSAAKASARSAACTIGIVWSRIRGGATSLLRFPVPACRRRRRLPVLARVTGMSFRRFLRMPFLRNALLSVFVCSAAVRTGCGQNSPGRDIMCWLCAKSSFSGSFFCPFPYPDGCGSARPGISAKSGALPCAVGNGFRPGYFGNRDVSTCRRSGTGFSPSLGIVSRMRIAF